MTKPTAQSIETQVALLNQFNSEVVKPYIEESSKTTKEIKDALVNLDYVARSEYVEDKLELRKEFDELANQVRKRDWVRNSLSAILGVVLSLLVTYVVTDILKG